MSKKIVMIMDPLPSINIKKDTTYALMEAAQQQGYQLFYAAADALSLQHDTLSIAANAITLKQNTSDWYECAPSQHYNVDEFDLIWMRKDPPFDRHYLYTTYLLDLVERAGVRVINKASSLRDCNEKLFATWFPQCCPEFMVTAEKALITDFLQQHHDIILKPLHGMGGQGIFRLQEHDVNTHVIIETVTDNGSTPIMVQRFVDDVFTTGDKRILMINGEAYPYSLARMPAEDETRANLAVGGHGIATALTERDQWICRQVGPVLKEKGLFFVGLDIIGDYLTEINVTSPTGLRELMQQTQTPIAEQIWHTIFH